MRTLWNWVRGITAIIAITLILISWTKGCNHPVQSSGEIQMYDQIDFGNHGTHIGPWTDFQTAGRYTFTTQKAALNFFNASYNPQTIDGKISFYCDEPSRVGNFLSLAKFNQLISDCPSGYIAIPVSK